MKTITATYRLQLHAHFGFQDARAIVAYLDELGISHAYASPYMKAEPGSSTLLRSASFCGFHSMSKWSA
jgi:maltooligosyltrehalose synthase